jgi:hypothetical protein
MTVIMWFYYVLSGCISLLLIWNFFKTDEPGDAFFYLLVLLPFLLRLARIN